MWSGARSTATSGLTAPGPIFETVLNGITVVGSIVGTRKDLREVFALHAAGRTKVIRETRSLDGVNDWKQTGYRGPCPPIGRHRYFHKLYALDAVLPDLEKPTRDALERAMDGHILAMSELMGTYEKHK